MIVAVVIIVVALVFLYIANNWHKEEQKQFDKKIKELGDRLGDRIDFANKNINSHVEHLLKVDFQLKHPSKYKVGHKAPDKGCIVTKVELIKKPIGGVWSALFDSIDNFASVKTSESSRVFCDFYYQYTSTNIKTGEVKTWAE